MDEGFILDKKIGVGQPKRIENAKILVANTAMDTDKIKIYGARVRVDSMQKVGGPRNSRSIPVCPSNQPRQATHVGVEGTLYTLYPTLYR